MQRAFDSETKRVTEGAGNNSLPIAFFGFLCLCFTGLEFRMNSLTLSTLCFGAVGVLSCVVSIIIAGNERTKNGSISSIYISICTLLAIGFPLLVQLFSVYFRRPDING